MQLENLQFIFNRSIEKTFSKGKLFLTFLVLALCGIFFVFCRGLALHSSEWIALSLTFLPFFLCAGIIFSTGIILIRIYHDEIKQKEVDFKQILANSWELILGASYFSIPMILIYLLLWMLLGIFLLLNQVPGLGEFLGVILAFAPFLLNFASILLGIAVLIVLFTLTPIIALKGINRILVSQYWMHRLKADPFANLVLFKIAIIPVFFLLVLMFLAVWMTGTICSTCPDSLHQVLQWFFIMIPFMALLSPALIFFFNFAAEAHVLMKKEIH